MSAPEPQRCPLCAKPLNPVQVRNALSRYTDRYICSACGTVEALTLSTINLNPKARECLYFDEVMGVALVNEKQAGYVPIWEAPPMVSFDWVRRYVDAVNERHGISVEDKFDIVGASMALGGAR